MKHSGRPVLIKVTGLFIFRPILIVLLSLGILVLYFVNLAENYSGTLNFKTLADSELLSKNFDY